MPGCGGGFRRHPDAAGGASTFTDTVTAPTAPFLYLTANPDVLAAATGPSPDDGERSVAHERYRQGTTITPAVTGVTVCSTPRPPIGLPGGRGGRLGGRPQHLVSNDIIFKNGFE
jgi:hypothetical protein